MSDNEGELMKIDEINAIASKLEPEDNGWSSPADKARIDELEQALRTFADRIEAIYGDLPSDRFPGPPTSIVSEMRRAAGMTASQ